MYINNEYNMYMNVKYEYNMHTCTSIMNTTCVQITNRPCMSMYITCMSKMKMYMNTEHMGWIWSVGSIKVQVSFAKEPYKRDDILQKRPIILSILLTVATP